MWYQSPAFASALISVSYPDDDQVPARIVDSLWRIRSFVAAFNENRRRNVNPSWIVVVDESMSAFRGEGMPHLSFIKRKPEPLGCELKTIADGLSGVMLGLELQEGKLPMSSKAGHREFGATTSCTKRLVWDCWI